MYSLLRSVKLDEIALKNEAVLMKLISQNLGQIESENHFEFFGESFPTSIFISAIGFPENNFTKSPHG